jgi:hypothetical protein
MFRAITDTIRSRTRSEWESYFKDRMRRIREYSQANGEKAALAGFFLGMVVVIFFKLALIVACVTVIAWQLVLILSESTPKT